MYSREIDGNVLTNSMSNQIDVQGSNNLVIRNRFRNIGAGSGISAAVGNSVAPIRSSPAGADAMDNIGY